MPKIQNKKISGHFNHPNTGAFVSAHISASPAIYTHVSLILQMQKFDQIAYWTREEALNQDLRSLGMSAACTNLIKVNPCHAMRITVAFF